MIPADALQWAGLALIFSGQLWILRRNGKAVKDAAIIARDTAITSAVTIKGDINNLRMELSHPVYGLASLEQRMRIYESTCANTRGDITARVINLENRKGT